MDRWVMSHVWKNRKLEHIESICPFCIESCHIYPWVMSYGSTSDVTWIDESCHKTEEWEIRAHWVNSPVLHWVMSHTPMGHVTSMRHVTRLTDQIHRNTLNALANCALSHVTYTNESCHMSHVTWINASCHTFDWVKINSRWMHAILQWVMSDTATSHTTYSHTRMSTRTTLERGGGVE